MRSTQWRSRRIKRNFLRITIKLYLNILGLRHYFVQAVNVHSLNTINDKKCIITMKQMILKLKKANRRMRAEMKWTH